MPNNKETLFNSAICFFRFLLLKAEEENWKDDLGLYFDPGHPEVAKAEEHLRMAIDADGKDAKTLCLYAKLMEKRRDGELAEEYFLRSLEADSHYRYASIEYANFLYNNGAEDVAESFLHAPTVRVRDFLYLSVHLPLLISLYLSVNLSICYSVFLSIYLHIRPSFFLFCLSISLCLEL